MLPGWIAAEDGVFEPEELRTRVFLERRFERAEAEHDRLQFLQMAKARLDDCIPTSTCGGSREGAIRERDRLHTEIESLKERPWIRAFLVSEQVPLWLLTFLMVGLLVFVVADPRVAPFTPDVSGRGYSEFWRALPIGFATYAFAAWPSVLRAVYADAGVPTVDYTTLSLSWRSFVYEQAEWLQFSVLLVMLWRRAHDEECAARIARTLSYASQKPLKDLLDESPNAATTQFAAAFDQWVVRSALLAICYLPDTFYYYARLSADRNPAYLSSGLLDHLVWGATWVIITLPLYRRWGTMRSIRSRAIAELKDGKGEGEPEKQLAFVDAAQPVGTLTFVLVQGAAGITFLLGLIKAAS